MQTTQKTFITLHDGSRVDADLYRMIKAQAEDRYDDLNPDDNHSIEDILGYEFLSSLSEVESIKAFKAFIHMVEQFKVPYLMSDVPSIYFDYFDLMPTAPSAHSF